MFAADINKLMVNPGSLLFKLCTMDGYTSILLLISVAFMCHGQKHQNICEEKCKFTCRRTWSNRVTSRCCGGTEGRDDFWNYKCRNGNCDQDEDGGYVLILIRAAYEPNAGCQYFRTLYNTNLTILFSWL